MYFICLFILAWLWFIFKADKRRIRELYGVAIYTSFLGLMTDLIMVQYKLWDYSGLPHAKYSIPLVLDFSVYPVVSYLFIQNLPARWGGIFWRIMVWTFFSIIFEWITLITHHIEHHQWWNLGFSFAADILIYISIVGVYYLYRPAYQTGADNLLGSQKNRGS